MLSTPNLEAAIAPEDLNVIPFHRPLIPFLREPWTSKVKYPAILVETFLYGVYVILFCSCFYALVRCKTAQRTLLAAITAIFLLASADIAVTVYFFFRFILGEPVSHAATQHEPWNETLEYKFTLYILANAFAAGILVARCYTLWQNKRVLAGPVFLSVIGTVVGFVSIAETHVGDRLLAVSFISVASANLSMTLLVAGRMWWVSRKAASLFKLNVTGRLQFIFSILVNSGAIYSSAILLYLVFHTLILDASLTQIAAVSATSMVLENVPIHGLYRNDTTVASQRPEIRRLTTGEPVYGSSIQSPVHPSQLPRLDTRTPVLLGTPKHEE